MEKFDWTDTDMSALCDAMVKAKKKFDEHINNKLELDGAYFSLEMTGYVCDSEFKPMRKVNMKFNLEDGDKNDKKINNMVL